MSWSLVLLASVVTGLLLWALSEIPDDVWRTALALASAAAMGLAFFGAFYLLGSSHA